MSGAELIRVRNKVAASLGAEAWNALGLAERATLVRAAQWRELRECWPWPLGDQPVQVTAPDGSVSEIRVSAAPVGSGFSRDAAGNLARLTAADRIALPEEWENEA